MRGWANGQRGWRSFKRNDIGAPALPTTVLLLYCRSLKLWRGTAVAQRSEIEWTDATCNPVTGCIKSVPGCDNCYTERFAERRRGIAGHPYKQGFDLRLWPSRLEQPAKWKKPRMIFVNSMSDSFHKHVERAHRDKVSDAMEAAHCHAIRCLPRSGAYQAQLINAELRPCAVGRRSSTDTYGAESRSRTLPP